MQPRTPRRPCPRLRPGRERGCPNGAAPSVLVVLVIVVLVLVLVVLGVRERGCPDGAASSSSRALSSSSPSSSSSSLPSSSPWSSSSSRITYGAVALLSSSFASTLWYPYPIAILLRSAASAVRRMKTCAWCGIVLLRPMHCGRCRTAYCGGTCQRRHWRQGHREECRPEPWVHKVPRRTRRHCRRLGRVLLAFVLVVRRRMSRWMQRMRQRLRRFVRWAVIRVLWIIAYVISPLQRIFLLWRSLRRDVHA